MDLKTLRGDLQKIVAVNACSKPLSVDLALGLIGAYVLRTPCNDISEWKAMKTFHSYLLSGCFKGKKKSIIAEGCFADCVLCILTYLSDVQFEKKEGTLLSLELKVITGVEDNGYLSFNNTTFGVYSSQKTINGSPANIYIVETTDDSDSDVVGARIDIPQDEPIQEPLTDEPIDDNNVTQVIQEVEQENNASNAVNLLVAEKKSRNQNACKDNSPFVQLYEDLLNKDRDNRAKAKYTWQWLLSLDEYNAIKECVGKNKIPSPQKWDNKTVRLLALYIGEYYKREYESNINPFAQFGDDSPNVKIKDFESICSFLNIEPYKKVNDAHKFTICVNGGLPVHYISTKLDKNKTNSLIDGLSKMLDTEDDIDRIEGEEVLKGVNTALSESYHNGHSIFEYIEALKTEKKTWNESDNNSVEFRDFKEKIREASKKANERKKFKIFYSLWTFLDNSNIKEFYITPQLRFNPEEDGERHYAISKQRLENWGIKNPPAQFSLRMGDTSLIFTICYNGDYISSGMIDRIDLPILDMNLKIEELSIPDYSIIYDDLTNNPWPLKNDFNLPFKDGYLQLYTDDDPSMASWNSFKGAQAFRWSGVLYDKNRYQLLSQITFLDINEQIGWVTFADSVTFEDTNKGKIRTIFNSKGKIYAKPATQCIHNIINNLYLLEGCLLDSMAECTIGDEVSRAYIVKSTDLKFNLYRAVNGDKVEALPFVEYKSASCYRDLSVSWQKYNSNELDQGLYVFRLSYGRYMTEVKCYVLPQDADISFQNTSQPNLIKFNGITNVTSDGIANSQKNNSIVFIISDNKDYYSFKLGDNYGNISLKTYHPRPQIHVYLHGREIVKESVIMAFADDTEIKYISAKSCKPVRLSEKSDAYKRLFNALTATALGNSTQLLTQAHSIKLDEEDEKSKLMIRVYTQEIPKDKVGSFKMMLLDLEDNTIIQLDSSNTNKIMPTHDSLLFQSLKDVRNTDVYYAPKFFPHDGQGAANNVKKEARQKKLTEYADKDHPRSFVSACAYQQFEIACEHKMYFAFSDPLLGMRWDVKNKTFLDVTKSKFKKNLLCFLQGYIDYTNINSHEPCVAGLKRLAREFLFDWKILKKDINNSPFQQLKELYQEIINN